MTIKDHQDTASRMHIQIRLVVNFGSNCGVPWHAGTNDSLCLICKQGTKDVTHFLLDCPFFKENIDSVWLNIKARITETNPFDGTQICTFISSQDQDSKVLLLQGVGGGGGGGCQCYSITRQQSLSNDLYLQQSPKSTNFTRINYVTWRLCGEVKR